MKTPTPAPIPKPFTNITSYGEVSAWPSQPVDALDEQMMTNAQDGK